MSTVVEQSWEKHKIIVTTNDGVTLSLFSYGHFEIGRPTILAVHGYPDNHGVWDEIAYLLVEQYSYNFFSYDVRGSGESSSPDYRHGYHFDYLIADIETIITSTGLGKVHLVGHDWGAIQGWAAVIAKPELFLSLTVISGPDLNLAGCVVRDSVRYGTILKVLRQMLGSVYIPFLLTPHLSELVFRIGLGGKVVDALSKIGSRSTRNHWPRYFRSQRDYLNGLNLYRENMPRILLHPQRVTTDIPVQIIVPTKDFFITPFFQTEVGRYISHAHIEMVAGGHWVTLARPQVMARLIAQWITAVNEGSISTQADQLVESVHIDKANTPNKANKSTNPQVNLINLSDTHPIKYKHSRGSDRSAHKYDRKIAQASDPIYGKLALITGAGSGIGRAIALELAEYGIGKVIIVDHDSRAAQQTAQLLAQKNTASDIYCVDVSSATDIVSLARTVLHNHGVVDILVNNAGIGVVGRFLETSAETFDRTIAVNMAGVINGCREFGKYMVERGQGGTIINMASAAAYLPSKSMVAYGTTKAAVLGFTESLRADFADEGIRVIAVCPGVINTNIVSTTIFAGASDREQKQARLQSQRMFTLRNYTPQKTAKRIVKAIYSDPPVVIVTPEAHLGWILRRISPRLLRWGARLDLRSLSKK